MRDTSPWIELHSGVREHKKITMLSELLKIDYAHAVGLLACIWSSPYAISHNGSFDGCNNVFLKKVSLWSGDADLLVKSLKTSKLLDSSNLLHDYDLHGTHILINARKRVQRYRNVTVTDCTERKKERKKVSKYKGGVGGFKKPILSDIQVYLQEIGKDTNQAINFFDYHESKGWIIGRTPMKDWKAACRTWIRNAEEWARPDIKKAIQVIEMPTRNNSNSFKVPPESERHAAPPSSEFKELIKTLSENKGI